MKKWDEIIEQYTNENEIIKIFELIKQNKIIKTNYFYDRILLRNIDEDFVDETLPLFKKIKLIDKRKHKKGDIGYDLHYELDNSKTLILGFIPLKNKTLLINAILRYRSWQSSIKS